MPANERTAALRIGWLSDVHLDHPSRSGLTRFLLRLGEVDADVWVVSGDIGEAHTFERHLGLLWATLRRPLFFVLGNHDFYGSSIREVRGRLEKGLPNPGIVWLTGAPPVYFASGSGDSAHSTLQVALVGDEGWGDARLGDAEGSDVDISDFHFVEELVGLPKPQLIRKCRELGDEARSRVAPKLEEAASRAAGVCLVTHVPPFEGAAWYRGKTSEPEWLPWFSCAALGDALLDCARRHPEVSFAVLCGHTHGAGLYSPFPNVIVFTGPAEYGKPRVQGVLTFEGAQNGERRWVLCRSINKARREVGRKWRIGDEGPHPRR